MYRPLPGKTFYKVPYPNSSGSIEFRILTTEDMLLRAKVNELKRTLGMEKDNG